MTVSYNFYSLINAFIPLFLISFFLLDSMLNVNLKGIILVLGICINVLVTIIVGNSLNIPVKETSNLICTPFTVSNIISFNRLPLNTTILSFVFIYLTSISAISGNMLINIPFILIIILLTISDSLWLIQNNCFSGYQTIISAFSGILFGLLWAFAINKSNNKDIIYNVGINNYQTCNIPKNKTYKCKTNKNN